MNPGPSDTINHIVEMFVWKTECIEAGKWNKNADVLSGSGFLGESLDIINF